MKIALLHDSILPPKHYGGIERIVMSLAAEYTRLGHSVVVAGREGSQVRDFEFISLPSDYLTRDARSYLPGDVQFLHSHQRIGVKASVPFLVTIHGNGHPDESYFANTNFLSRSHARNHNAKYFVFNGVEPERYPFSRDKQDYFVFLAKTTWRVKNLKTTIAWARDLGVRLEIMGGSGNSTEMIHYNGLVDDAQKADLLKNARALVYPTNWDEPCAAAPLEAMACGTPVITSNNGCMPELVQEGCGVVCKSYEDMLEAIGKIPSTAPDNCRAAIEKYFSLSRMAQDYLALIEKILTVGELDQSPRYNFNKKSVQYLYKPTVLNQVRLTLTGKI